MTNEMTLYFFSGLGADERVFQNLEINQPNLVYIKWVKPEKRDSISSYCENLAPQINLDKPRIFIGVSFGGIIAQEMAKKYECEKLIIISSVKTEEELEWKLRFVRRFHLNRLFPYKLLSLINQFTGSVFMGVENKEEKKLLEAINKDSDPYFVTWATNAVLRWTNKNPYKKITHIHGTKDKIFPVRYIKDYIPVKDGKHFMIVSKAKEIESILKKELFF